MGLGLGWGCVWVWVWLIGLAMFSVEQIVALLVE